MRKNKNIINFLFKKKEEDKFFVFDTPELQEVDQKIEIANNEIQKFINSRIHPKCRYKMNKLINEHTDLMMDYSEREEELFYEEGFIDGVRMILECLFLK